MTDEQKALLGDHEAAKLTHWRSMARDKRLVRSGVDLSGLRYSPRPGRERSKEHFE